jgi:hypothetical protein
MVENAKLNPKLTIQVVKFSYSEMASKDSTIFHFLIDITVALNYKWKMGQIVVVFSEYLNFNFFPRGLWSKFCIKINCAVCSIRG